MRIAINGFGRIGRSLVRALWQGRAGAGPAWPGLELVAINDIATAETCAYLFQYDSVFGRYPGSVALTEGALVVDGHPIRLIRAPEPDWASLGGVDLVLDCTGRATARAGAAPHLDRGAGRVLVSGPCAGADFTVVLGANEDGLRPDQGFEQRIVSNASCTTNALAPLVRLLDSAYGILTGDMLTVHCYTASQPSVDTPTGDLARSRAAALSMVPTTTSAQRLLDLVLPDLAGRITGSALRVPVASVSAVDLKVTTHQPVTAEEVNALLQGAAQGRMGHVFGYYDTPPLVSSDLRQIPQSIIMAGAETRVTDGGLLRVFGWYDNEWGFSNRMLDVACLIAGTSQRAGA